MHSVSFLDFEFNILAFQKELPCEDNNISTYKCLQCAGLGA